MRVVLCIMVVSVALLVLSCGGEKTTQSSDEVAYTDTIVYNVSLNPVDPRNEYEAEWLKGLNREALVDSIFASIYYHGAEVKDFTYENVLTLDEVKSKEIEDERFSRDKVSLLQFTEAWRYDVQRCIFDKKVLSVHIAYEVLDENGVCIGHRGGFIVKMRN